MEEAKSPKEVWEEIIAEDPRWAFNMPIENPLRRTMLDNLWIDWGWLLWVGGFIAIVIAIAWLGGVK